MSGLAADMVTDKVGGYGQGLAECLCCFVERPRFRFARQGVGTARMKRNGFPCQALEQEQEEQEEREEQARQGTRLKKQKWNCWTGWNGGRFQGLSLELLQAEGRCVSEGC